MKKWLYATVIVLIFSNTNTQAQKTNGPDATGQYPIFNANPGSMTFKDNLLYLNSMSGRIATGLESNVSGTPFLKEDFTKGVVVTREGTVYADVPLRFNLLSNEIEFKNQTGIMSLDKFKYAYYFNDPADTASIQLFVPITNGTKERIYRYVGGNQTVQLLSYEWSTIEEVKTMGYFGQKELVKHKEYYVYDVKRQSLEKVKLKTADLKAAFRKIGVEVSPASLNSEESVRNFFRGG